MNNFLKGLKGYWISVERVMRLAGRPAGNTMALPRLHTAASYVRRKSFQRPKWTSSPDFVAKNGSVSNLKDVIERSWRSRSHSDWGFDRGVSSWGDFDTVERVGSNTSTSHRRRLEFRSGDKFRSRNGRYFCVLTCGRSERQKERERERERDEWANLLPSCYLLSQL